jgi:predicted enzyme related to lactoylglutathione lyase
MKSLPNSPLNPPLTSHRVFVPLADPEGDTLWRFYQQLFGLEPAVYLPQVYAEFDLPGLRLGIFKPKDVAEFGGTGNMSLCVEVADLEAAIACLSALGQPPPGAIKVASHGREIYAYDPLGNRLILQS